jgi:hypothetical protein
MPAEESMSDVLTPSRRDFGKAAGSAALGASLAHVDAYAQSTSKRRYTIGGGDDRMRDLICKRIDTPEWMKLPDSRAGAMSCLTGIAIRNSIDRKRPIRIADLVEI